MNSSAFGVIALFLVGLVASQNIQQQQQYGGVVQSGNLQLQAGNSACIQECLKNRPKNSLISTVETLYLTQGGYNSYCKKLSQFQTCMGQCGASLTTATGSQVGDCYVASYPLREAMCSGGRDQFRTLMTCYNNLKSAINQSLSSCRSACGSNSSSLSSTVDSYCQMSCLLQQQSGNIQQQCNAFTNNLIQQAEQVYNRMNQIGSVCFNKF